LRSLLLLIDVPRGVAYRVFNRGLADRVQHSCFITHVAPMGRFVIYVIGGMLVTVSPGSAFPRKRRTIAAETEAISAVCASSAFSVVAYATDAGRLAIVSVRTRKLVGRPAFLGERAERLLVTENWGFVIAMTRRRLYTFSLTGLAIGNLEFKGEIIAWTSFVARGADFVLMVDKRMKLYCFEAFRLETLRRIEMAPEGVVAMSASRLKGTLMFVTADGRVIVRPLPIP
jgi:hypothetical protein